MRCFVGIPLEDGYQKLLEDIINKSKIFLTSKISWTRIGNWHLTLCFLGELSKDQVEIVKNSLKEIKFGSFFLKPGAGGFFPSFKRPRVLWLGLEEGVEETRALAQEVQEVIERVNINYDKKEFVPHLTLGRVKKEGRDKWLEWLRYVNSIEWKRTKVSSFVLWQSILTPQGPKYRPVWQYDLL